MRLGDFLKQINVLGGKSDRPSGPGRQDKTAPSNVGATPAAGAGVRAPKDQFIPSSARKGTSLAPTRGERPAVELSGIRTMRELEELPDIQAWLRDSPPDERENRKHALKKILQCIITRGGSLDLGGLGLTRLPESIGQLKGLKQLWVDHNSLQRLPVSIGQLKSLEDLSANDNSLRILPESIRQLHGLKKLSLDNNSLKSLPDSIGQLRSLQYLHIDHNSLESLPESIGQLEGLQTLSVNNNKLPSLPKSIGQLQGLRSLHVARNRLQRLPACLGQLQNLTEWDVAPLNMLVSILEQSLEESDDYEDYVQSRPQESTRRPQSAEAVRSSRCGASILPVESPEGGASPRPAIKPPSPDATWISHFAGERLPKVR